MKILIDGYEANVPQRLGSSQVGFELLKGLERLDKENDYLVTLPSAPLADLPSVREGWVYKILRPKGFWTRVALPLYIRFSSPDLVFSPTHYLPRFIPSGVKKVALIFDLSFLHFPSMFKRADLYKLNHWTKYSLKVADRIVVISKSTKADVVNHFRIPKTKVTVAYPGYDQGIFKKINNQPMIDKVLGKYGISGSYIIYTGTVQPRKNLVRLIEAVSKIEGIILVVVGKTSGEGRQGWMYQETLEAPKKYRVEDQVIFTGFVPTKDLPYLYSGARCFVLPSLWEGFGIPVVEAMACGIPVIVSNTSSLPEIVGEAGLKVDPENVDQIEQAIRITISDQRLRDQLIKAGLKKAKMYNWDKMARKVLRVFKEVGGTKL